MKPSIFRAMEIKMRRYLPLAAVLTVTLAVFFFWLSKPGPVSNEELATAGIVLMPTPRALPDVPLMTLDGEVFGPQFFAGKWTMVLFGYTFCPDICPTALSELKQVYQALPAEAHAQMGVTMVSVDPNRDTPQRMQQYVTYFDPSFTGMTGEIDAVQAASSVIGLPFVPGDTDQAFYTVVHSGNLALIDPEGQQVGFVRGPLKVKELGEVLPKLFSSRGD